MDNFFIKTKDTKDTLHLLGRLKSQYTISEAWEEKIYCGVTLTMPNYVADALKIFQHPSISRLQHAPRTWVIPAYGQKIQLAEAEDISALLDVKGVNLIQNIIEKFYYYTRALDHTMLVALGELATKQKSGTVSEGVVLF